MGENGTGKTHVLKLLYSLQEAQLKEANNGRFLNASLTRRVFPI